MIAKRRSRWDVQNEIDSGEAWRLKCGKHACFNRYDALQQELKEFDGFNAWLIKDSDETSAQHAEHRRAEGLLDGDDDNPGYAAWK